MHLQHFFEMKRSFFVESAPTKYKLAPCPPSPQERVLILTPPLVIIPREKKEIERKPSTDFEILLMTDG
jgi:hypothetical protein